MMQNEKLIIGIIIGLSSYHSHGLIHLDANDVLGFCVILIFRSKKLVVAVWWLISQGKSPLFQRQKPAGSSGCCDA
jgi:hypothetical protein